MRTKCLWITWAHLAVLLVLGVSVAWISFANVFLTPKYEAFLRRGIIDPLVLDEAPKIATFPHQVQGIFGQNATWWLIGGILAAALFEWGVRGENKSWIRLALLSTASVALTVIGVCLAASYVISFALGAPAMGGVARPYAVEQSGKVETSLRSLEDAAEKENWPEVKNQLEALTSSAQTLSVRVVVASLSTAPGRPDIEEFDGRLNAALKELREAAEAAEQKNANSVRRSLRLVRNTLAPVFDAAKKPKS